MPTRCKPSDRIIGLELGDDCMTKPFEPRELVTRIHIIQRRVRDDRGAPRKEEPRASYQSNIGWLFVGANSFAIRAYAELPVYRG